MSPILGFLSAATFVEAQVPKLTSDLVVYYPLNGDGRGYGPAGASDGVVSGAVGVDSVYGVESGAMGFDGV